MEGREEQFSAAIKFLKQGQERGVPDHNEAFRQLVELVRAIHRDKELSGEEKRRLLGEVGKQKGLPQVADEVLLRGKVLIPPPGRKRPADLMREKKDAD